MDIGNVPPFTRFYLVMVIITTFLIAFIPKLPTFYLFAFSIKKIVYSFQYWRLITNFLIAKKFSIDFFFFIVNLYVRLYRLESDCIKAKRYAEFIMTLFYNCSFIILISFFNCFALGYTEARSLLDALTYSLLSINSYKSPNDVMVIFFIPVRNLYAPVLLAFVALCSGGSLMSIIIGLISGYLYVLLKEILPKRTGYELIWIPILLKRLCKDTMLNKKKDKDEDNEENRASRRREPYVHINPNDSMNTAFREQGTVIEGNEFRPNDVNEIQW